MHTTKSFVSLFFFVTLLNTAFGQFELNPETDTNFYDIQNRFYSDPSNFEDSEEEGGGYAKYKRWEAFWERRIGSSGSFNELGTKLHSYINSLSNPNIVATTIPDLWSPLGPYAKPTQGTGSRSGIGQMERIIFDPDYANNGIIYATAIVGGLWQGNPDGNGGFNWIPISDRTPVWGCGDAEIINYSGDKYIFISLGAYEGGFKEFGLGIYRSVNGSSFTPVNNGLQSAADRFLIPKITANPSNPNEVFAATEKGVFRTQNALAPNPANVTWTLVLPGIAAPQETFVGLAFKPGTPTTVYASGQDVYVSTSSGDIGTWTSIGASTFNSVFGSLPGKVNVETAGSNYPNELFASIVVYTPSLTHWDQYIWRYDASTTTWTDMGMLLFNSEGSVSGRVALAVDPSNHDVIFAANERLFRRTLHSSTWTFDGIDGGYNINLHADIHDLKLDPITNSTLFIASDGGIDKTDDPFNTSALPTITDISNGLQVSLVSHMGTSPTDEDVVIIGTQDDGTIYTSNATQIPNNWHHVIGGDGYQALVDNENPDIMYGSVLLTPTFIRKTFDSWYSNYTDFTTVGIYSPNAEIGPKDNQLYSFRNQIGKRDNVNNVWLQISSFETDFPAIFPVCGSAIKAIALSPSDEKYIYASAFLTPNCNPSGSKIFKSVRGGGSGSNCTFPGVGNCWIDVSPTGITEFISDIDIDGEDPDHVYFTCAGLIPNQKVFESKDGGNSWINISSGIADELVANCITYEKGSNDVVYVGTDNGIYYKDRDMANFEPYFDNIFPHCIVNELQINYKVNKIRAGTAGRGVWESPLLCPISNNLSLSGSAVNNDHFETNVLLESIQLINSPDKSRYRSCFEIDLLPDATNHSGFTAQAGSNFRAFIHKCDMPGNSDPYRFQGSNKPHVTSNIKQPDIDFIVFPNPNKGAFTLKFLKELDLEKEITIRDLVGNVVYKTEPFYEISLELDLTFLSKGIYLITSNVEGASTMKKVVIF